MARQRHLANAPIREAVLELRTSPPQQDIEPTLREIIEGLEGYKEPTTLRVFEGNISFSGGDEPAAETVLHRVQGFRASSEDDLRVIQFKVDGVTFSRLAPYTTWEEVAAEAKILWQAYADVIAPETVTRIAVRYINHIRLPHPIRDIDDYFTSLPRIPDTLPQVFTSFLSRVTIFEEERQFSAHVSHALVDDIDPDRLGVILDIDAFHEGVMDPTTGSLWETFEGLRGFKNLIFFESITERTAEMFE